MILVLAYIMWWLGGPSAPLLPLKSHPIRNDPRLQVLFLCESEYQRAIGSLRETLRKDPVRVLALRWSFAPSARTKKVSHRPRDFDSRKVHRVSAFLGQSYLVLNAMDLLHKNLRIPVSNTLRPDTKTEVCQQEKHAAFEEGDPDRPLPAADSERQAVEPADEVYTSHNGKDYGREADESRGVHFVSSRAGLTWRGGSR